MCKKKEKIEGLEEAVYEMGAKSHGIDTEGLSHKRIKEIVDARDRDKIDYSY